VKLTVELECYPTPRNAFTAASLTNGRLAAIIRQYNPAMKPTLVFCSTRKDAALAAQAVRRTGLLQLVPSREHQTALSRAAEAVVDRDLKAMLPTGVGFHNGNLCRGDRLIVQELFTKSALLLLMATSGLAVGVCSATLHIEIKLVFIDPTTGRSTFRRTSWS
jgi:ATP-dependent DNA helicase HFM1/MER3